MIEAKGDLWTFPASWRVITTCGRLNTDGDLIMGIGTALVAKKLHPGLPKKLGDYVYRFGNRPFLLRQYGLITFPTKHHWRDSSSVNLIMESARKITIIADKHGLHSIVMPRPGCGNGGLTWDFVKPYIEDLLDDRFTVVTP